MDGAALHDLLSEQSEYERTLRLNTTTAEARSPHAQLARRAELAGTLLREDSSRFALAFFNRLHSAIKAELITTYANSGVAPPSPPSSSRLQPRANPAY